MMELTDFLKPITLLFLILVGLGLGASTTLEDFRSAFQTPKAVAVGFLSQYLFMPIAAYLLTLIFQLDTPVAVGVIIIGCSPGGTTSNLFTYWSNGDLALSITMSFLSTCAAFVMMPLWAFILIKLTLGSSAKLAWTDMISALFMIIFPTCAGVYIRTVNTERKIAGKFIWKWIELLSSIFGFFFLIASIVIALLTYGNLYAEAPRSVWALSAIMLPLGCIFGYFVSKLLGMSGKHQRTISLEAGIQNLVLSVAIVQISFADDPEIDKYLLFPVIYGLTYLFWAPLFTVFFRYYLSPRDVVDQEEPDGNEKSNSLGFGKEDNYEEKVILTKEEVIEV